MIRSISILLFTSILAGCASVDRDGGALSPRADHHQHLMSPAAADLVNTALKLQEKPTSAADMVKLLDEAGIERAVILSNAYFFDSPRAQVLADYPALVRVENDWTASEAEKYPERLVPFCSFNPLLATGLVELERCAASGRFRGIKLHFNLSDVDLQNWQHLEQVRKVFVAANRHRLPIIVHAAVPPPRAYGAAEARRIIENLVTAAPDIPIIIAHLWGGGDFAGEALLAYINALRTRPKVMQNVYFDVAQAQLTARNKPEVLKQIAERIRQIGPSRILYGSDGTSFGGQTPSLAQAEFRKLIPLTAAEHDRIARNLAPFLRK